MYEVPTPSAVRLERPPLELTLSEMASAIAAGSRSSVAAAWTADAAREAGDGRELSRVARILAQRIRETVTYAPDGYGGEDVQTVGDTLETRRAGDCDDYAVAFAALARRAGLRTGLAVYYRTEDEEPVHVVPVFEDPDREGAWIPVEITTPGVPFGAYPVMDDPGAWQVSALQESGGRGVGFLPLLGAAIGLVGTIIGANATRGAARDTSNAVTTAATTQARAATDVARIEWQREREAVAAASQLARERLAASSSAMVRLTTAATGIIRTVMPYALGIAALSAVGNVVSSSRAPKRRTA